MPINPYQPPLTEAKPLARPRPYFQTQREALVVAAIAGAGIAVVSSIPLAGLIGLVFRFPVPMVGPVSGPDALLAGMIAAMIYGALGGVIVQAAAGSAAGTLSLMYAQRYGKNVAICVILGGVLSALPGLLLLSVLDWIIGPW